MEKIIVLISDFPKVNYYCSWRQFDFVFFSENVSDKN